MRENWKGGRSPKSSLFFFSTVEIDQDISLVNSLARGEIVGGAYGGVKGKVMLGVCSEGGG